MIIRGFFFTNFSLFMARKAAKTRRRKRKRKKLTEKITEMHMMIKMVHQL